MRAVIALGQGVSNTVGRVGIVVLGAAVGLGVPFLWIWIGSQVQASTAPSWTALAVVHAGMITTLLAIASVFSFIVARSKDRERARADWMRGQSEGRRRSSISGTHPLEMIIFFACSSVSSSSSSGSSSSRTRAIPSARADAPGAAGAAR